MKKLVPVLLLLVMLLCSSCEAIREAGIRAKEKDSADAGVETAAQTERRHGCACNIGV